MNELPPPTDPPPSPKQVTRFEAGLLRLLRSFFHRVPEDRALKLVNDFAEAPPCLSAAAIHLVGDTLAKGCVLYLVRAGGWERTQFLREGLPRFGRLWERLPSEALTLHFSRATLDFLIWLTVNPIPKTRPIWYAPVDPLTIADALLLYLAYTTLRADLEVAAVLRQSPAFRDNALCRLVYPDDFSDREIVEVPAFEPWLMEPGSTILEALQPILEQRYWEMERAKGQIGDWLQMRRQGQSQLVLLERFLAEVERVERPDLARFVLKVLGRVLSHSELSPTYWTGGLQGHGPPRLADRLETQRSALALLRHADQFQRWQQRAQTRGYFDEGYPAAKFWLGQWEALKGEQVVRRAAEIVQMLEPLHAAPAG